MKVVIVGGGSAGLAIGWRLAQAGASVEIVERGLAGRGSTWAAAGMLAVTAEMGHGEDAHAQFAHRARGLWRDFAQDLEEASGRKIFFQECGSLLVANDQAGALRLTALAAGLAARGERASWLDATATRAKEPLLGKSVLGAIYAPDDAQVDNRALGEALAIAFVEAGGRLRELCDVSNFEVEDNRVRGVISAQGSIVADRVILAAGAWSSQINGVAHGIPPIKAAKGQMAALTPPKGQTMPRHLLWGEEVYLVPRQDTLLVGATVEDTGFETSVEREARETLIANAAKLMPCLQEWRVSESWAGLRPRAADSMPVLGATRISGLFVASGQFRNGILFAPAIADALRRMIFGGTPDRVVEAFDPCRFSAP